MSEKSSTKTKAKTKKVQFGFYAPGARKVCLAGDFNSWDIQSGAMRRDSKGTWKVSVSLEPGRYEYRFWVDGVWHDDPKAQERSVNPFGSQNCVKIVS